MAVKAALFLMSPLDWNSAVVSVWGWGVAMGTTTTPGGVGRLGSCTAVMAGCCSALGSACLQYAALPIIPPYALLNTALQQW